MSQTSNRMFASIKFSRRRIQPIQLFKGDQRRLISVYEKNDENPKCTIYLKREEMEEDVLRQLRLKDTVLDYRQVERFGDGAVLITLYSEASVKRKSFRLDDEKQLSCYLHRDSTEEDIDSQLVHLFNYLSDLFNNKTVTVWLRPSLVENSHMLFSNLQFESCQLLKILVGDDSFILSNEEITRLLEVWKPTIGITIKCRVEENFGPRSVSSTFYFSILFSYFSTDSESPTALYFPRSMAHFR